MKNISKNLILWLVIGLLLIVLFNLFQGTNTQRNTSKISFSDFMAATESGNVSEVNRTLEEMKEGKLLGMVALSHD